RCGPRDGCAVIDARSMRPRAPVVQPKTCSIGAQFARRGSEPASPQKRQRPPDPPGGGIGEGVCAGEGVLPSAENDVAGAIDLHAAQVDEAPGAGTLGL